MAYTSRRRTGIALLCALLAAVTALPVAAASAQASTGTLTTGSYESLTYELYVPASYRAGTAVPLIVALHGCTQSADVFRKLTRFDQLADQKGFIVVFPEQPKASNKMNCWNWFKQEHLSRGSGEPSLIAGITQTVQQNYTIDPHRTYVAGLSAGGAMAEVMVATYPDIYAAVGVGSGCEYAAGAACAGYKSADPDVAGRQAYQAMGSHARVVPFMVFEGDKDSTVPPINAKQVVRASQVTADLADDGTENRSIPAAPRKIERSLAPGGRSHTVEHYSDGHGNELGQYWLVHGMGHAWSGGDASEQYSDPAGPDESAAMYDFFMSHPAP